MKLPCKSPPVNEPSRAAFVADVKACEKLLASCEVVITASESVGQALTALRAECEALSADIRDGARARIKVMVKRILKKHGYPPDLQEEATKTVLAQAELLCADWGNAGTI